MTGWEGGRSKPLASMRWLPLWMMLGREAMEVGESRGERLAMVSTYG